MIQQLRITDHASFQRQVIQLTLAGTIFGGVSAVFHHYLHMGGRWFDAIWTIGLAFALGLVALPLKKSKPLTELVGAGCLAGLSAILIHLLAPGNSELIWLGYLIFGSAVGVLAGRDLNGPRWWLVVLVTGVWAIVAWWVTLRWRQSLAIPPSFTGLLSEAGFGALFGFMMGVALITRQLNWEHDPVAEAYGALRERFTGEVRNKASQVWELYINIKQTLGDRQDQDEKKTNAMHRTIQELVLNIIQLCEKWQMVELGMGRTHGEALQHRIEMVEEKIDTATDALAKQQYGKARDAMKVQLEYLRQLSCNRERIMARLENFLVSLERVHLALWNHRGTNTARLLDEVQPILDEIDEHGQEMDITTAAINEVITGESAATISPTT